MLSFTRVEKGHHTSGNKPAYIMVSFEMLMHVKYLDV